MSSKHYENFPVASLALPRRFRRPVSLIYAFARQADDFADEGELSNEERIKQLDGFRHELDNMERTKTPLFVGLASVIRQCNLPMVPFYDLLAAFTQDVNKKRYANFAELLAYCEKSANPVGRLLLSLYGCDSPENRALSDDICTSLQLINFLQDVAIDYGRLGRIYLPQDEMEAHGVTEADIAQGLTGPGWRTLMAHQAQRARAMMLAGAPLVHAMQGRLAFEMKLIVLGGLAILDKLEQAEWDVYRKRPKLGKMDWFFLLLRALHEK